MTERVLADAKVAGLRAVRLEVVASNQGAVALYESLGFVAYGRANRRLTGCEWDLLLMNQDS